jgi:twitching motility two-component system response regulator PilG
VNVETNFEGIKVVVIDDSKTIRRVAEVILKKVGCQVVTITVRDFSVNDADALLMVIEYQPHIIFIGTLPFGFVANYLDAYQICAVIKSEEVLRKVPIVIFAGENEWIERERSRIVGAKRCISKPFTREELLNTIKAYVIDKKAS